MRRLAFLLLLLFPANASAERLQGIFPTGKDIPLYAGPSEAGGPVDTLRAGNEAKALVIPYEYEMLGLVVLEAKDGGWYRVYVNGRSVWIRDFTPDEIYLPYPDLLESSLTYIPGRDFSLLDSPGGKPVAVPLTYSEDDRYPVEILETMEADGAQWIRVGIQARSPCEQTGPMDPPIATGWLPAYKPQTPTAPSVWFYPRGC